MLARPGSLWLAWLCWAHLSSASVQEAVANDGAPAVGSRPDALGGLPNVLHGYAHNLSAPQLRRGLVFTGANLRLRRVLRKLQRGDAVHIGVIGGSVSWGFYMDRGVNDWFALVARYLQDTFPQAHVTSKNGCVPATTAEYVAMCLGKFVDERTDLVFVEYVINDGYRDTAVRNQRTLAMERLLRKLLAFPNAPAVVLMQALAQGVTAVSLPFWWTVEDQYGVLAQHYSLPALSMRNALFHEMRAGTPGSSSAEFYPPVEAGIERHPSAYGHKLMADLAVALLQQTFLDALLAPLDDATPAARLLAKVPSPMFPANFDSVNLACRVGEDLPSVVVSHEGWAWVNEGTPNKPKWGYVSSEVGATLLMVVDTRAEGGTAHPPQQQQQQVGQQPQQQQQQTQQAAGGARRLRTQAPATAPAATSHPAAAVGATEEAAPTSAAPEGDAYAEAQAAQAEYQTLSLAFEGARAAIPGAVAGDMIVWVGYLRSWRAMGHAKLFCASGCACQPILVDSSHRWRTSQSFMAKLYTTQAAACTIGVTIVNATSSGGHRFKVSAVMVSRRIEYGGDFTDTLLLNAMQGEDYKGLNRSG